MLTPLYQPRSDPMRLAIFMSGSGTNAKRIIEKYITDRDRHNVSFEPVLIFTDNPKSAAFRIATQDYEKDGVVLSFSTSDIGTFYDKQPNNPSLNDKVVRALYDQEQVEMLRETGVDAIALAGYDWVVTSAICDHFLTVNVHPGDLRVIDATGKRKFTGLGWVPSAKAILAGKKNLHSSLHQVTSGLDAGPLLYVSSPVELPSSVLSLESRAELLGEATSLRDVIQFEKEYSPSATEMGHRFPIYAVAKLCQEQLKIYGDWKIFPETIDALARGKYTRNETGQIYFEGVAIPNGKEWRD